MSCQIRQVSARMGAKSEQSHTKGVVMMAENNRRLPIGVQSFEKLRQGGYL